MSEVPRMMLDQERTIILPDSDSLLQAAHQVYNTITHSHTQSHRDDTKFNDNMSGRHRRIRVRSI